MRATFQMSLLSTRSLCNSDISDLILVNTVFAAYNTGILTWLGGPLLGDEAN